MSARPLWTLDEMARAMRAKSSGKPASEFSGISIDSRSIKRGEAFFAIKGERHDGHDFVAAALQNGAEVAIVAENKLSEMPANAPLLIVPEVLEGLTDLAKAARARTTAKIVAVTGSVGKTSTKEALKLALSRSGDTHASVASFNNHWGVPLTLARLPSASQFGVFEIGMNHAGEIVPLTKLVKPHVAIVTTVAPVHLEFFGSLEAIADAKAEIFQGVESLGAVVLNRDSAQFERLSRHASAAKIGCIVSFGEDAKADARLIKCALHADCSIVDAVILGTPITYKIGAPGRHLVFNSLAVLATAHLVGADLALAALALAEQSPAAGRGTRTALELPVGKALLIDESYNANPVSMRAAIELLGQAPVSGRGRRIAVLGDMLELGSAGPELHRELVRPLEENDIDIVFCAGPLMNSLWQVLPSERRGSYAASAAELENEIIATIQSGDTLMVKGSFGSRMGQIVKALTSRYPSSQNSVNSQG